MINLHESGILERLKTHHFRSFKETPCDPEFTVGSSALGVADVWPIFAIVGVGMFAAIVCLLLEKVARGRKNSSANDLNAQRMNLRVEDLQMSEMAPGTIPAVPSTSNIATSH